MPTPLSDLRKIIEQKGAGKFVAVSEALNQLAVTLDRENFLPFVHEIAPTHFDFLMDVTAVDYLLQKRKPRFEVVYHLFHTTTYDRIRIKVRVPEEDLRVDSLYPIWEAAYFLEREVWDLYGISFPGHPDLRRILLYDQFEGHPLRKDYPILLEQPIVPLRPVQANPTH